MCLDLMDTTPVVVLLICIYYFDFVIRCGPYPQVQVWFKKKKKLGKESQYMVLRPGNWFGSANRVGPGFGV